MAAADNREPPHRLAVAALLSVGPDLVVLDTVMVETERLLRHRYGNEPARRFLAALVHGEHRTAFLTPGLLQRATEIDEQYADLGLGLVDASIMAYAERHDLPILTLDFRDFRATESERGPWKLVLNEEQLRRALG